MRHAVRRSLWLVVLPFLLLGCPAPSAGPSITVTSHVDGQRVFGSRNITLAGTAQGVDEVRVLYNGTEVDEVPVTAGAFAIALVLGDNASDLRVETLGGLVGVDLELVFPAVDAWTFRPADVVVGQPSKTAVETGLSATRLGGNAVATGLFVNGILYLPDPANHRILGYLGLPESDGAAADFVLGQSSFGANAYNDDDQDGSPDAVPTARTLRSPTGVASDGTRLFVADGANHRVLIFQQLPTTNFAAADVVVGQASMDATAYSACSLDAPIFFARRVAAGGGRLLVTDEAGHRVLVWTTIPTTNGVEPDLVLGQPRSEATCEPNDANQDGVSGDRSARTLYVPQDVWTDGSRLLVADTSNARVLLWQTFPTVSFAPADVVIGQASMTERVTDVSATSVGMVEGVASNGNQIAIADYAASRVLVYNAFPTANGAAASRVLGQSNFFAFTPNDGDQNDAPDATPSARTLNRPQGVWMGEGVLLVSDTSNRRYLLFVD